MRHLTLSLIAAMMLAGCTTPEKAIEATNSINNAMKSGQSAASLNVASSSLATQEALFHITAALSGPKAPAKYVLAQASEAQPTYTVDTAAGTGKIELKNGSSTPINLTFKFEKTVDNEVQHFNVTSMEGTAEGFKLTMSQLMIDYTPKKSAQGEPLKTAAGDAVYAVTVQAKGTLSANDKPQFELKDLKFDTQYPLPDSADYTELGKFNMVSLDNNMIFAAVASGKGKSVKVKGLVSTSTGLPLHNIEISSDGKVSITEASSAS